MKKINFFFMTAIILSILTGCKKEEPVPLDQDRSFIANAKQYFDQQVIPQHQLQALANNLTIHVRNPRKNFTKNPIWQQAITFNLNGNQCILVPVKFENPFFIQSSFGGNRMYDINSLTRLFLYKDKSGNFHCEWLNYFPDSSFQKTKEFTGILFIDDWQGNSICKLKFEAGGKMLIAKNDNLNSSENKNETNGLEKNTLTVIQTCYTIEGYNTSPATDETYYWSESAGCDYTYIESYSNSANITGGSYGGAGGNPAAGSVTMPTIYGGNNIIGNVNDYNKCFTNTPGNGYAYSITVCVDQPVPGTREAWGLSQSGAAGSSFGSNPVNVGHCFLIFTEKTPSSTIIRNIGLYPKTSVTPISPSAPGQYNNDDLHGYNISLTMTIDNGTFFNMLNYVSQNEGQLYDLNTNNCTSFVLHTLYSGNIYFPSTIGHWPDGSGNDPGDLGEDIRSMALTENMSRNTYKNHPNSGNCYLIQ